MNIAIDVTGLFWRYRTGIQNYYWGLISGLTDLRRQGADASICLVDRSTANSHRHFNPAPDVIDFRQRVLFPGMPHFDPIPSVRGVWRVCQSWNRLLVGARRRMAGPVDALWRGCDVAYLWPWDIVPVRMPGVILIPDLLPQRHTALYDSGFVRAADKAVTYAQKSASAVVTLTKHVRDQLIRGAGIPGSRIHVAYPGIDDRFRVTPEPDVVARVIDKYGVSGRRYVLSVGFLDPRKNIARLIGAFERIKALRTYDNVRLVFVGPSSVATEQVLSKMRSSSAWTDIVITGYVPDEEMPMLYRGAAVSVYCSQDEGFGIPNVEAMACGCPVITSDAAPFPEVCGDAARYADPGSMESIADQIMCVLDNGDESRRLRVAGIERAKRYTYEACAAAHMRAFASVCAPSGTRRR